MQRQDKEYIHGLLGVEAAKIQGVFRDGSEDWDIWEEQEVATAANNIDTKLQRWRFQLEQSSLLTDNHDPLSGPEEHSSEARVQAIADLWQNEVRNEGTNICEREDMWKDVLHNQVERLNDDQQLAYDIIDWHLNETISGKKPPQLLMVIPGEGGVGKTKLIQTITQNFYLQGVDDWLVKGAYTGIAASLIDGKTLHVLVGIRNGRETISTNITKALRILAHQTIPHH